MKKYKEKITIDKEDLDELYEYAAHASWRCRWYGECRCGLDKLTDKLGLSRIPIERE
jgi:hypothetical protein